MIPSQFYAGLHRDSRSGFFFHDHVGQHVLFISKGDKYIVYSCNIEFCRNTVFELSNFVSNFRYTYLTKVVKKNENQLVILYFVFFKF